MERKQTIEPHKGYPERAYKDSVPVKTNMSKVKRSGVSDVLLGALSVRGRLLPEGGVPFHKRGVESRGHVYEPRGAFGKMPHATTKATPYESAFNRHGSNPLGSYSNRRGNNAVGSPPNRMGRNVLGKPTNHQGENAIPGKTYPMPRGRGGNV